MPFGKVMEKFKKNTLHSGSKDGPKVKNRKQAVAIMMSEKKKADSGGKPEYKKRGHISTGPSKDFMKKFSKAS